MKRLLQLLFIGIASFATLAVAQEPNLPNVNELPVRHSENGVFSLAAEPALKPVRLNAMHYWTLRLADAEANSISGATIAIDGGMPGHGHGLPTSPRVFPGEAPGEYVLKGLRFNMSGVWELKLDIDHGERSDRLLLQFVVEDTTEG